MEAFFVQLLRRCFYRSGLKIQIHVCGTYVLSVWFTLSIGFGSAAFGYFLVLTSLLRKRLLRRRYSLGT